jgi:hypothetical protein
MLLIGRNFALPQLQDDHPTRDSGERISLTDAEVERLAEILGRGISPTLALREALSRLADPERRPPELHWKETSA